VYIIIAIASWYYPNPDVATSNSIPDADLVYVPMTAKTLRQLHSLLNEKLDG
jgi:Ca2+:H+ antiporter